MEKIALFPGSFDPITIGHEDIIQRALPLFDKLIIGVGNNGQKTYLFPLEKRLEMLNNTFKNEEKITSMSYSGLTIDLCKEINAQYMLRGLRSTVDFEFEKTVAQLNLSMNNEVETVFIIGKVDYCHISSTIVREIIANGGDFSQFIPAGIKLD